MKLSRSFLAWHFQPHTIFLNMFLFWMACLFACFPAMTLSQGLTESKYRQMKIRTFQRQDHPSIPHQIRPPLLHPELGLNTIGTFSKTYSWKHWHWLSQISDPTINVIIAFSMNMRITVGNHLCLVFCEK